MSYPDRTGRLGRALAGISEWLDAGNSHRDSEAITWGRLSKVAEECGEVIAAFIGVTGQNPRKGLTHDILDVKSELLDVAVTALGAWEHLDGHQGYSIDALIRHVQKLNERVGLEYPA